MVITVITAVGIARMRTRRACTDDGFGLGGTLLIGPASAIERETREHADLRLYDALRRVRTVCGYLPVRYYAHRYHVSPGLQHRAEHVLGVLLLREGLSAVCD
jgi:hypothetical protein